MAPPAASTRNSLQADCPTRCTSVGAFMRMECNVFADPDVRTEQPSLEEKRQCTSGSRRGPETFSSPIDRSVPLSDSRSRNGVS